MTSVLFYTTDTILATYTSPSLGTFGVLISYDGGLTWQDEMTSATFFYPNMFASKKAGNGNIYIGGENYLTTAGIDPGMIYQSHGSITNWSYENVAESIRDIDSYGDSVVFAVGQNGYIVVNQDLSQLGLYPNKPNPHFEIFPNPNKGEFTIELGNIPAEKIEIVDAQGRIVFVSEFTSKQQKINVSKLNAGFYYVQVKSKDEIVVKEVVVQ